MVTFLQIVVILLIIALIAMILGYIVGQFSCRKLAKSHYIQKGSYCEGEYAQKHGLNEQIDNLELEMLEEAQSKKSESANVDDKKSNESKKNSNLEKDDSKLADEKVNLQDKSKDSNLKDNSVVSNADSSKDVQTQEVNISSNETQNDIDEKDSNKSMPKVLDAPINGKPDNLCKIKGIGTVIEGKLNDLGIFHFEQIASWSEEEIKWVDGHLSFSGRIIREDWVGQAKLLAKGEETEFSKRVEKGEVESSKKD